jgi:hypothetical protein
MASSLKTLEAQVAELTALVNILATQGASVTVTETKPAKKSRKKKAKGNPLSWYYGAGKEGKLEYRNAIKDALREAVETEDDFVGWTFAQLTDCALDNDVSLDFLDA